MSFVANPKNGRQFFSASVNLCRAKTQNSLLIQVVLPWADQNGIEPPELLGCKKTRWIVSWINWLLIGEEVNNRWIGESPVLSNWLNDCFCLPDLWTSLTVRKTVENYSNIMDVLISSSMNPDKRPRLTKWLRPSHRCKDSRLPSVEWSEWTVQYRQKHYHQSCNVYIYIIYIYMYWKLYMFVHIVFVGIIFRCVNKSVKTL